MSKNDPNLTKLDKYDVEANIEEIDNGEDRSVFKYGFTALSNPKNVRLSIEGTAQIIGDPDERESILSKDENDVPKILTMIYQELFPTFFLLSKSLNVACPPHTIGSIGEGQFDEEEESETEQEVEAEIQSDSVTETDDTVEQEESPDIAQPTV